MAKNTEQDSFTDDLIKSLNKSHGSRVAYNLAFDESPTHVKRWISTGSKQLDYIISNHLELDHAGATAKLAKICPKAKILATGQ